MLDKIYRRMKNINRIDFLIIVAFFVGIFSFLFFTRTLTSGYHFIDDHWIIKIQGILTDHSFLKTVYDYIKDDFLIRFRPFYGLYYISTIKVFGLDFFRTSVFVGLIAAFSFSLFYIGMRKLKHSYIPSIIFVLLIFCGSQMAIWWRLGTNETIGVFFFGLSFYFMSRCLGKNNYKLNNILFVAFLIIMSLCKESFIITIPAFVLFKVWNEKRAYNITTKESLKNNKLLILPLAIMVVELLVIKFLIGTNKIGYAGITSSVAELIAGVKNIIFNLDSLLNWMNLLEVLILIYLISFLFTAGNKWREFTKSLYSLLTYLSFALLLVIPEILMHAKSGMGERYLLPTTIGLAFLAVGFMQNTKQKIFKFLILLAICIFIATSFHTSIKDAKLFADSGKDANILLSTVKDKSQTESNILLVISPIDGFEISHSIKTYLSFYGFNNLYGYPVMREEPTSFEIGLKNQWIKWFENKRIENIKGLPDLIIIFDPNLTETFFSQSKILRSDYENIYPYPVSHGIYLKK